MSTVHEVFVSVNDVGYPMAIDEVNPETGRGLYSGETLEEVRKRYPNAERRNLDDVILQQETVLRTEPEVITEEAFNDALDTLPPQNWIRLGKTESFAFMERYSGRITTIYARVGKTYWKFMDVYSIGHAEVVRRVEEAAAKLSQTAAISSDLG